MLQQLVERQVQQRAAALAVDQHLRGVGKDLLHRIE